jgi:hypothetical protein
MNDGAAALIIMSGEKVKELGWKIEKDFMEGLNELI